MKSEEIIPEGQIADRKSAHVRLCLEEDVAGEGVTSGFEKYHFRHQALPELDFATISLQTSFLNQPVATPLLISSMTGGSQATGDINKRLATVAEQRGWAMGLGSVRAAIEHDELAATFNVRQQAPNIPIIANLGAVQLNYGFGIDQCRRAVDLAEASALVLHLNSLQEVFQPEGNVNFAGLLLQIEQIAKQLEVPIGIKEVGWGIDGETARLLVEAGASFIDVAGAGGTSWSQVEKFRSIDPVRRAAAEAFAGWGTPTAECIVDVRQELPEMTIIGSGGLKNGVDAAKAIALGADFAGFGRSLLGAAVESTEALEQVLAQVEFELSAAMLGIGAGDITALQSTTRLRSNV